MTVISYTSDLVTIDEGQDITPWSAIGGGGAGLTAEGDFAIQSDGSNLWSITKQVSNATKGMVVDFATTITNSAGRHFFVWIYCATPGILASLSAGGMRITIGTTDGDYVEYYVEGNDTYAFGGQKNIAVRYQNTAPSPGGIVGSPGADPQWFGGELSTTATSKSINLGIDVIRYGTGYYLTGGTGADEAGSFTGLADDNDNILNQNGLFRTIPGGYEWKGKLVLGQTTGEVPTACEFTDTSGPSIVISDNNFAESDFTQLIIDHASTIVNIEGATFEALGTNDPGQLNINDSSSTVSLPSCRWKNWGTTSLEAGTTVTNGQWIEASGITQNSAVLTSCTINSSSIPISGAAIISNDPALITKSSFTSSSVGHAVEMRPSGAGPFSINYSGNTHTSYAVGDGSTGNEAILIHPLTNGATVTLNIVGGGDTPSIMEHGDYTGTFTLVVAPVSFTVTTNDAAGNPIQNCRVLAEAANGSGPLPFEDSVSIVQTGGTATVTHSTHGLTSGQKVNIEGVTQTNYNGIKTISNVGGSSYDYTIDTGTSSPASGTPLSTAVVLDGLTDVSGEISDTRSYGSNQPLSGRIRKSTVSPLFKTAPITATVDKDSGASIVVQMISDE